MSPQGRKCLTPADVNVDSMGVHMTAFSTYNKVLFYTGGSGSLSKLESELGNLSLSLPAFDPYASSVSSELEPDPELYQSQN